MAVPIYVLQDVGLTYRSREGSPLHALHGVTCQVATGEFFTIIGPSGCGKTTLLKLMSGLILPSEGQILFRGGRITGPVKGIGMAFQDSLLLPWRSVLQNVLLPIEILRQPAAIYLQKARDLLAAVGLEGFEDKPSWQLSGGMRQRVSLCRALIADPAVLLLDEPFGALDAFTREELWAVLQRLHERTRCTIILVTHQLNEAMFLSDRVTVLSARPGRLIYEHLVSFRRPRDLPLTYTADFATHLGILREKIQR